MLGGCLFYLLVFADIDPVLIPQKIEAGLDSFSLLAVPFFVLLGELMSQSEVTLRLVRLATNLLGFMRSGLAQVNILASMLFSGVSGAAVSDASALGSLFIPAMKKEGYTPRLFCSGHRSFFNHRAGDTAQHSNGHLRLARQCFHRPLVSGRSHSRGGHGNIHDGGDLHHHEADQPKAGPS